MGWFMGKCRHFPINRHAAYVNALSLDPKISETLWDKSNGSARLPEHDILRSLLLHCPKCKLKGSFWNKQIKVK
jgi:hypothetical protein